MKTLVILGTARGDSHTLKAIRELCPFKDYELVDLRELSISRYNYESQYPADDSFLSIAQKMSVVDNIVFATPVYWYSMSGVLKEFFDRLSDLLSKHKPLGRSLKGKDTYLISSGYDLNLPPGFEEPFRLTSEYFEMNYRGGFYKSFR